MTIDDDCQHEVNIRPSQDIGPELDAMLVEYAASDAPNEAAAPPKCTSGVVGNKALLSAVKQRIASVKASNGYDAAVAANAEVDAHRKTKEGKADHAALERGKYEARIMREQKRPVRPYSVPDTPEKAEARKKQQAQWRDDNIDDVRAADNARKQAERDAVNAMEEEQRKAVLAVQAAKKKAQRQRKADREALDLAERNAKLPNFGRF